jgi:hypothetical protein
MCIRYPFKVKWIWVPLLCNCGISILPALFFSASVNKAIEELLCNPLVLLGEFQVKVEYNIDGGERKFYSTVWNALVCRITQLGCCVWCSHAIDTV